MLFFSLKKKNEKERELKMLWPAELIRMSKSSAPGLAEKLGGNSAVVHTVL